MDAAMAPGSGPRGEGPALPGRGARRQDRPVPHSDRGADHGHALDFSEQQSVTGGHAEAAGTGDRPARRGAEDDGEWHSDYRDSGDGVGIGARGTGPGPPDKPSGFRPPPCTGGAGRERAAPGRAADLSGGAAPKRIRRALLILGVAWKIQEHTYGGNGPNSVVSAPQRTGLAPPTERPWVHGHAPMNDPQPDLETLPKAALKAEWETCFAHPPPARVSAATSSSVIWPGSARPPNTAVCRRRAERQTPATSPPPLGKTPTTNRRSPAPRSNPAPGSCANGRGRSTKLSSPSTATATGTLYIRVSRSLRATSPPPAGPAPPSSASTAPIVKHGDETSSALRHLHPQVLRRRARPKLQFIGCTT